jgi:putative oxidoreductase
MNERTRGMLTSLGLLILRVGTGGLLLYGHGWAKITHYSERAASFANPIGVGPSASFALVVFAEVICSTAVALGLWTRLAAVPPVIFFLVAALIQHGADPFDKKELALVYMVPFLALMFLGGGRYALSASLGGKRARRA